MDESKWELNPLTIVFIEATSVTRSLWLVSNLDNWACISRRENWGIEDEEAPTNDQGGGSTKSSSLTVLIGQTFVATLAG